MVARVHGERKARGGSRPAVRKVQGLRYALGRQLDARTAEGRIEREAIEELTDHVGGNPTFPQRILIRRAARLLVMVEEVHLIASDEMSDWASRQVIAWSNSLRRTLEALGLNYAQRQPKKLADVLHVKAVA
jgi:hypothetical protein